MSDCRSHCSSYRTSKFRRSCSKQPWFQRGMTWPEAGRIHRVVLFWASSLSQRSCILRQGKILIMQFPTKISKALLALMYGTAVITALPGTANAQTVTGSIEGSVTDPSGALVPNATITIRNTDLGPARTILTSRDGAFRASGLISGAYTVDAKADKLALRRPVRITLTLGSSTEVALKLEIPRAHETTTVRARAATVEGNTVAPPSNTTEASVTTFLPGLTITYLPNRDRDFTQFTNQTAGAEEDPEGTGIIMAGQRAHAIATQVDGTGFNDALLGGRRAAEDGGVYLPMGVVREFQLVRS